MKTYGLFPENLIIDSQSFSAELADPATAKRAGFEKIFAIKGLPTRFIDSLALASQICDVPHTWRVKEYSSENQVPTEVIDQAKAVLVTDQSALGSHIITYVGGNGNADYEFLAAGAIRDKLTRTFHNEQFPVVSRAIVAPKHRGKGIGSFIVEHRFTAVLRFFQQKPKAIHFGTDSEKILRSVRKVEREQNIRYAFIGNEEYTAADGTHTVADYLCVLPWYREELLRLCDEIISSALDGSAAKDFKSKLELFITTGIEEISGTEVENLFEQLKVSNSIQLDQNKAFNGIQELFDVKHFIGAKDPK